MLKSNLRILLRTNVGERPMNPTFGIRLREFMFDQITDEIEEIIKDSIYIAVAKWMPAIKITKLDIQSSSTDSNPNIIGIKSSFELKNNIDISGDVVVILTE